MTQLASLSAWCKGIFLLRSKQIYSSLAVMCSLSTLTVASLDRTNHVLVSMKAFCLACILLVGGLQAVAVAQTSATASDLKTFDIRSEPQFANYKSVVAQYAQAKRPAFANDFCILGYVTGDNLKNAFVIWQQGRQIIVWYGGDQSLADSQRIINLRSDVVPTEKDLHGSTYLVTKAWVADVTGSCARGGVAIHVPGRKAQG
jgi:hypothetical protein